MFIVVMVGMVGRYQHTITRTNVHHCGYDWQKWLIILPGSMLIVDHCGHVIDRNYHSCGQDARRRKLDSGRVDAEAVIDELMEVKT